MKNLILLSLISVVIAAEYYTTGNDRLDMDAFFADRARVLRFLKCYLDRGPCPKLALSYKRVIPDAIVHACKKCNQDQKHIFWEFLKRIQVIFPVEYRSFRRKYDPENKYFKALVKEISKY